MICYKPGDPCSARTSQSSLRSDACAGRHEIPPAQHLLVEAFHAKRPQGTSTKQAPLVMVMERVRGRFRLFLMRFDFELQICMFRSQKRKHLLMQSMQNPTGIFSIRKSDSPNRPILVQNPTTWAAKSDDLGHQTFESENGMVSNSRCSPRQQAPAERSIKYELGGDTSG